MENKTDCGQKCFELQDTEHALAVEKENNQKLEAEVLQLLIIIKSLDQLNNDLNNQTVRQDREITNLKKQIEKMKNVGNCKHTMQCSKWVEQHIYQNNIKCCSTCDRWELAE